MEYLVVDWVYADGFDVNEDFVGLKGGGGWEVGHD
jgi:hypothetical protein